MTRKIKLAAAAIIALGSTSAFATNGDNLIGLGAKARGMGGVGIATSFGAESGLANPALLSNVKDNEIMFGGTLFMPSVEFGSNTFSNAGAAAQAGTGTQLPSQPIATEKSKADKSVIPEVALASRINENIVFGIGMYGVAGMGTDYRDTLDASTGVSTNGSFGMRTNLQLMRFAVPVAYSISGFSIGVAPMLQYGSLNIAYAMPNSTMTGIDPQGTGVSDKLGFGYEVGAAYTIAGLTIGAKYQSAIDMEYKYTLETVSQAFGLQGIDDHLEQPAEMGVGISYEIAGNTLAVDYKQIKWGSAKGYKDFGWEDQSVIAVGYQYAVKDSWAIRLGYNYAKNPIKEQDGGYTTSFNAQGIPSTYEGAVKNFFNMAGFPAVVESHITAGGSYSFSKMISVDAAFVYAPEVTYSYDTTGMAQGMAGQFVTQAGGIPAQAGTAAMSAADSSADVKHSQTGVTIAVNYKF